MPSGWRATAQTFLKSSKQQIHSFCCLYNAFTLNSSRRRAATRPFTLYVSTSAGFSCGATLSTCTREMLTKTLAVSQCPSAQSLSGPCATNSSRWNYSLTYLLRERTHTPERRAPQCDGDSVHEHHHQSHRDELGTPPLHCWRPKHVWRDEFCRFLDRVYLLPSTLLFGSNRPRTHFASDKETAHPNHLRLSAALVRALKVVDERLRDGQCIFSMLVFFETFERV